MSETFMDIEGRKCACGEDLPDIHLDLISCGNRAGLTLKQHGNRESYYIDLTPKMIADLVDALIEWQMSEYRSVGFE